MASFKEISVSKKHKQQYRETDFKGLALDS